MRSLSFANNINNTNDDDDDDGSTPFRGRKGSDMKYSSISPSERSRPRVPSAKTISNQCFPPVESSTSSSSSPESLLVDNSSDSYSEDGEKADGEEYVLDANNASPDSKAIMDEVQQIYEASPIPKSYLNSPKKKSPMISSPNAGKPKISLHPTCRQQSNNKYDVNSKKKKHMEASSLLEKAKQKQPSRNRRGGPQNIARSRARNNTGSSSTTTTSFAATKAAYGGNGGSSRRASLSSADAFSSFTKGNNRNSRTNNTKLDRRYSTAPNHGSLEWDDTNVRSTKASKKPVPLAVQRERQQRNQRLKEAKNASSGEVDGRRNLDKRTARLRYGDAFKLDIMQHRQRLQYLNNGSNHSDKACGQIQDRGQNGVSIAVRKRPIFDYEIDRGDYDIVSIDNTNEPSHDVAIIHNAVMVSIYLFCESFSNFAELMYVQKLTQLFASLTYIKLIDSLLICSMQI